MKKIFNTYENLLFFEKKFHFISVMKSFWTFSITNCYEKWWNLIVCIHFFINTFFKYLFITSNATNRWYIWHVSYHKELEHWFEHFEFYCCLFSLLICMCWSRIGNSIWTSNNYSFETEYFAFKCWSWNSQHMMNGSTKMCKILIPIMNSIRVLEFWTLWKAYKKLENLCYENFFNSYFITKMTWQCEGTPNLQEECNSPNELNIMKSLFPRPSLLLPVLQSEIFCVTAVIVTCSYGVSCQDQDLKVKYSVSKLLCCFVICNSFQTEYFTCKCWSWKETPYKQATITALR